MDGAKKIIILSKVTQTQKDKYDIYLLNCRWSFYAFDRHAEIQKTTG